jgi:outer membrane protein TolC
MTMRPVVFAAWLLFPLAGLTRAEDPPRGSHPGSPHDVSLKDCFQIAIEQNAQLRAASTQFLASEGRVISLHAILYPKLQAQALTTPTTLFVQFQQTLYNRATLPQLRLSRLSREQAAINYRQSFDDVMFQVRQTFINALAAHAEVGLFQNYAEREEGALDSARQLFDSGKVQKNTVLGIQVKANLARRYQAEFELQSTQALLALSNVLGQSLPESTHLTGELLAAAPAELDAGKLTATALQNRQDLKLLESLQLSAEQQIEVDMQNAYPILGISSDSAYQAPAVGPLKAGGYDLERNYNEPSSERAAGDSQLPISLYATWRIFDGGELKGVKLAEKAQIASREVAIQELRHSISNEVNNAVATMITERDNLHTLNEQASEEELRRLADAEFESGRLRQLDKAYLEDDILQQQQQRITAKYRLSLAAAALDHALGDGLETSVARPRP